MTSEALLEDLGHRSILAASAQEALDLLAGGESPDAVITDFAMPGLNGAQLAIRLAEDRPALPVILASGYAELKETLPAAVVRLTKPYGQKELAAALDKALPVA